MKVLLIGAAGQLGSELSKVFADTALYRADLDGADIQFDITWDRDIDRCIREEIRPDLVVNAAAEHHVPKCEERPHAAFAVNATAVQHTARACRDIGARMIHVSTDYVFGHGGHRPYVETDTPAPLSIYAASKLAGEHLLAAELRDYAIVRSSGLYGTAPCRAKGGRNFVELMLHLATTRPEVRVVTDEVLTPTYAVALAHQIRRIADDWEPGLYHATCNGECSWYDFAKAVFEETDTRVNLQPATSAEFPSPVQRPSYSVLANKHLCDRGMDEMPEWREALRTYLKERKAVRGA